MATKTPRLSVLLTKRQHEVITSMSMDSGQSMSKIIQELIEPSMPVLERLAATFQHLRKARDADRARVVAAAQETQDQLEPILNRAVSQIDLFLGDLEKAYPVNEKPIKSVPSARSKSERQRPPSTNRGVTPPPPKPSKPMHHKASRRISKNEPFSKTEKLSTGKKGLSRG